MVNTRDDSRFIYDSIASLEEHLVLGSFLASLVVLLFIRNVPAMIISALAIPASLIATFTLMRAMDFTLNSMTLLGLTLAVGIVIDDAIVVLENIFRKIDEEALPPFRAAVEGTGEVMLAVAATSLSLVVIFLPVAFMTGYAQRFIYPFGLTMAFAIMVSLLVSVTLTPMLSARFLGRTAGTAMPHQRFYRWIDSVYTAVCAGPWRTAGPSWRSACSPSRRRFPSRNSRPLVSANEDQGEFDLTVDAPEGTSLAGMEKVVQEFGQAARGPARRSARHADDPGAGQPLPPASCSSAARRAIGNAGAGGDGRREVDAALSRRTARQSLLKSPIGGGENAAWPILATSTGPTSRR